MNTPTLMATVKVDRKKILADIIMVGGAISAVLAVLVQVAPKMHISAGAMAILVTASSVVATIVAEARRFNTAKKVALAQATGKPSDKRVIGK